jgi:hypothetical protein
MEAKEILLPLIVQMRGIRAVGSGFADAISKAKSPNFLHHLF